MRTLRRLPSQLFLGGFADGGAQPRSGRTHASLRREQQWKDKKDRVAADKAAQAPVVAEPVVAEPGKNCPAPPATEGEPTPEQLQNDYNNELNKILNVAPAPAPVAEPVALVPVRPPAEDKAPADSNIELVPLQQNQAAPVPPPAAPVAEPVPPPAALVAAPKGYSVPWNYGLNLALSEYSLKPGPTVIQGLTRPDQEKWAQVAQLSAQGVIKSDIKAQRTGTVDYAGSTAGLTGPSPTDKWVEWSVPILTLPVTAPVTVPVTVPKRPTKPLRPSTNPITRLAPVAGSTPAPAPAPIDILRERLRLATDAMNAATKAREENRDPSKTKTLQLAEEEAAKLAHDASEAYDEEAASYSPVGPRRLPSSWGDLGGSRYKRTTRRRFR